MAVTRTEPGGKESFVFYRYLETVGDGSGDQVGTGDYSVTPRVLRMDCQPDEFLSLHFLSTHIQDGGTFDPAKYGVLAALTNGVLVSVYDEFGVEKLRITESPIKDNGEWFHYGQTDFGAAGAGGMISHTLIDLAGGTDDGLRLYPGQSLRITLNDNFTGLDSHDFIAHGRRTPT